MNNNTKEPASPINYKIWDTYWRSGDPGYQCHKDITERVLKLTKNPMDIIVEIGSGLGVDAIEIASYGYTVIALDISREALKLMKSKIKGIDVIPVLADALHLPFKDGSVDLFYHQGVMEHFTDPAPFLEEQKRSLKSGGTLLVDVPQTFTWYTLKKRWAIFRNKWFAGWETQYSPWRLRRLLGSSGFKIIKIYGRDYDLLPLVWIRDIEKLGTTRFGHPIVPELLRRPIGKIWRLWEKREISNCFNYCIGAIASKDENRN